MRRKIFFLLLLLFPVVLYAEEKLSVTLFYSPTCKVCLRVKEEFLPRVAAKYHGKLEWKLVNTHENENNLNLFIAVSAQFKREGISVPAILVGNTLMVGSVEIEKNLDEAIQAALRQKTNPVFAFKKNLLEVFKDFSIFTVMGGGLADGINPCAFAVIIFFVSFLAIHGYRKRDIVLIGSFYCLAVFVTYLLIGLGVFNFLYTLKGFYLAIKIFYYFVALICFIFAGLSFYDSIQYKKTREADGLILQLPKFLKKRINLVIGSNLREGRGSGAFDLAFTSFLVGFLVSLLEAACTGQVYVPTIVFILQYATYRTKALGYLLLYNLMFILPLVVIFLLALAGVGSQKFSDFLRKHLSLIKIILAFIFILLGATLIWDEIKYSLQLYLALLKLYLAKFLTKA